MTYIKPRDARAEAGGSAGVMGFLSLQLPPASAGGIK